VLIFGATAPYQQVQDYGFSSGRPLSDIDINEHRPVVVIGNDVAEKLFERVDPVGQDVRVKGERFTVVGVIAKKGKILGQSFDGFMLMPLPTFEAVYGRRQTATISVKMAAAADVPEAMSRAEEAMRVAHHLRPGVDNDFAVETTDALVSFWRQLTGVLFTVVPAVVAIGIVVGGIVIMNIMLMSVSERTHESGIRKAVGATARDISRQFLAEAIVLASAGGLIGVFSGWTFAALIALATPLPARVTLWSVLTALILGATVGVVFGVYPARRAAQMNPIAAMRAE